MFGGVVQGPGRAPQGSPDPSGLRQHVPPLALLQQLVAFRLLETWGLGGSVAGVGETWGNLSFVTSDGLFTHGNPSSIPPTDKYTHTFQNFFSQQITG